MAGQKVLIVEDNPMNMQLTADLLEIGGYVVIQAETAEEGIELAKAESPELILMDISLPSMDGWTATQTLKEDPQTEKIPVVAMTAHAMKGDEEKSKKSGCKGYITKPIDTRAFLKEMNRLLG